MKLTKSKLNEMILEALGSKKCIQVCYDPPAGFTPADAAAAATIGITKAIHQHKVQQTAAEPIEWGKGEGQK